MAELERVKSDQKMYKAFSSFQESVENTLEMAYKTIKDIDSSGGKKSSGSSHNE
jgi:hypothetical protein